MTKRKAKKLAPLEKDTASLREEIKTQAEELESRAERVAELETLLKVSLEECENLREGSDVPSDYEALLSEKDTQIEILEAELSSYTHLNTTTQPALDEEQAEAVAETAYEDDSVAESEVCDESERSASSSSRLMPRIEIEHVPVEDEASSEPKQ